MTRAPATPDTTLLHGGPTPKDREQAILIVADQCRTMQPEASDLTALLDFLEED